MSVGLLQSTELKLNAYLGSLVVQGNGGSNTIAAATTLTAAQSGVTFGVDQNTAAANYNVEVPAAAAACGVEYNFIVTTAGLRTVTFTTNPAAAATFVGFLLIKNAGADPQPCNISAVNAQTITFAAAAGLGARIKLTSNGAKWLVEAYSPVAAGITVA